MEDGYRLHSYFQNSLHAARWSYSLGGDADSRGFGYFHRIEFITMEHSLGQDWAELPAAICLGKVDSFAGFENIQPV